MCAAIEDLHKSDHKQDKLVRNIVRERSWSTSDVCLTAMGTLIKLALPIIDLTRS